MKKLIVFIATLVLMVSIQSVQTVEAASEPIYGYEVYASQFFEFTSENIYSDYYVLESEEKDIPDSNNDPELIDIRFLRSGYHRNEYGGIESEVMFYDAGGDLIKGIPFSEIRIGDLGGNEKPEWDHDEFSINYPYRIPLERYGVEDAESVKLRIAQSYNSVPSGYLDSMNDAYNVFNYTEELEEYSDPGVEPSFDFEFENREFFGDVNGLETDRLELAVNVEALQMEIPETVYSLDERDGINSEVIFYDISGNEIETYDLTGTIEGTYEMTVPGDAAFFRTRIMQSYDNTPGGYVDYFNRYVDIQYDEANTAYYYVGQTQYDSRSFLNYVDDIEGPDSSFVEVDDNEKFIRWVDKDGNPFNFSKKYDSDQELYAIITESGGYFDEGEDPTSPGGTADSLHTVLADFNMDSPGGNTIFTVLVLFVVNAFLVIIKVRGMAMPIVNIAVLAVLFFGGFTPLWVMLILAMILSLMFLGMRGGIQRYE